MKVTIEELVKLTEKADKWDALNKIISEFHCNEKGEYDEENPVRKGDLTDIGEYACILTGWL